MFPEGNDLGERCWGSSLRWEHSAHEGNKPPPAHLVAWLCPPPPRDAHRGTQNQTGCYRDATQVTEYMRRRPVVMYIWVPAPASRCLCVEFVALVGSASCNRVVLICNSFWNWFERVFFSGAVRKSGEWVGWDWRGECVFYFIWF